MNQSSKRELVSGILGIMTLGAAVGLMHAPLLIAGSCAVAAYVGGRLLLRGDDATDRTEREREDMIARGRAQADAFLGLAPKIADRVLSERVRHMGERVAQILEEIEEHPEKADDAASFVDAYLPRSVEIVRAYVRLTSRKGVDLSGDELKAAEDSINLMADSLKAMHRKLFREEIARLDSNTEGLRQEMEICEPDIVQPKRTENTP